MKLKTILPENKGLALFSLFVSISLWIVVTLETEHKAIVKLPIIVKSSKGMIVGNYTPKTAEIFIKAKGREFLNFYFRKEKVILPVTADKTGTKKIVLTNNYIKPEIKGTIKIISPHEVFISTSKKITKKVRLYADIRGNWKSNKKTIRTIEMPDSVKIEGAEEEIKLINIVYTEPVLLDTLKDTTFKIKVIPPDSGIKLTPSQIPITFHLDIETEKSFKNISVKIVKEEDMKVTVNPPSADITVSGPKSIISKLSKQNITISIDVGNKNIGKYNLPAEISLPEGVNFVKCEPSEFTVIIQ